MAAIRIPRLIRAGRSMLEGAGVHVRRAFGSAEDARLFDPFLLLDDFHSEDPNEYIAGFPRHPHRGMETVTYLLQGRMRHSDSIGNHGELASGGVQWMTAGSGIVHEEMPELENGLLWGLQLWVNLPSSMKMMPPRYQDLASERIPESVTADGVRVRAIAGHVENITGPVVDIIVSPVFFDFTLPPDTLFELSVDPKHTVFAYVLQGAVAFGEKGAERAPSGHVVLLGDGDLVQARAAEEGGRFVLAAGAPIREPIAWQGPVVMNTEEEVARAFREYREGTFVREHARSVRTARG